MLVTKSKYKAGPSLSGLASRLVVVGLLSGFVAACGDGEESSAAGQGVGGPSPGTGSQPLPAPAAPPSSAGTTAPPVSAPAAETGTPAPTPPESTPPSQVPDTTAESPPGMPGSDLSASAGPDAGAPPAPEDLTMAEPTMPMPDPGEDTYHPCPTTGEPCKILPFGDSITEGIYSPGAWRVPLFEKAIENGKSITYVGSRSNGPSQVAGESFPRNHQATSGITIGGIHRSVPSPALDDGPHIVLIHIGTNDMTFSSASASSDLESLLDDLIEGAPDALFVVAQIIPRSSGNTATEAFNATIPAIVEERAAAGAHISMVDMYTGFESSMLQDSVHPNDRGNEFMADLFYEAIDDVLP